jgi:TPR repeat protein
MIKRWLYHTSKAALRVNYRRSIANSDPSVLIRKESGHIYSNKSSYRLFHVTTAVSNSGEDLYQKALELMELSKVQKQEKEQERSKKMYEAWQKSIKADRNPKSQGVAVVKTLVKETRKEKKNRSKDSMEHAIELLETAANDHQHPMALVQLGNIKLQGARKRGSDPEEMALQAMDLFRRAGEGGSRVGWYNFGNLLWTGYPVDESDENDESADNDNTPAVEKIIKPDLHKAMEAFMNAIDLGDTDAMYLVGVHRMTSGGRENIRSGLNLVQKAADSGHGGAIYYLALLNLNGEPTIRLEPCSLDVFVQLLDRAVEAGNVDALFTRGHSFFHGSEGYEQDYKRALEDFALAADSGHADSAVSAGAMLHGGKGVPKDQRRAFEFYQMAGELGSKDGWQNVVACYTTGEGVAQSLQTAQYIVETMLKEDLGLKGQEKK